MITEVEIAQTEHSLEPAITHALGQHKLRLSEVRVCLLFGSRARGYARRDSDVDLIFIVDKTAGRSFEFRRFIDFVPKIDSNVLPLDAMDGRCLADIDWAYRLYNAVMLPRFSREPESRARAWLNRVNQLIDNPIASAFRCATHAGDLSKFLNLLEATPSALAHLSCYLVSEILHIAPLALLNAAGRIPYQSLYPGEDALTVTDLVTPKLASTYRAFTNAAASFGPFGDTTDQRWDVCTLRTVRHRMRRALEEVLPTIFALGYRNVSGEILQDAPRLNDHLAARRTPTAFPSARFLLSTAELAQALVRSAAVLRGAVPRFPRVPTKSAIASPRRIEYHGWDRHLKVILPTGGCRVRSCTFCMLPSISAGKGDIARAISTAKARATGAVSILTVHTDGSFFDDRELSSDERVEVARLACVQRARELRIESLPQFATKEKIRRLLGELGSCKLRIGMGLQSTNQAVRSFVTKTPIRIKDVESLLAMRCELSFGVRVYLLAGKWLMSSGEDMSDVAESCTWLARVLRKRDIVTVNPLIPTSGTPVSVAERCGFFEPYCNSELKELKRLLRGRPWPYKLEFGPLRSSLCTDVESWKQIPSSDGCEAASLDPRRLPWVLLGNFPNRARWAAELCALYGAP